MPEIQVELTKIADGSFYCTMPLQAACSMLCRSQYGKAVPDFIDKYKQALNRGETIKSRNFTYRKID